MSAGPLRGRLALVTGATRGIGFGAAEALAMSGADLIVTGRNVGKLEQKAEMLRQLGARVHVSEYELQRTEGIKDWYAKVCDAAGTPDILVNAAGMTKRGPALDYLLSDWMEVMTLNATAMFELSRCFARKLVGQGRNGRVINVASLMTAAARPDTSAYTASKGAVGQLTKVLAVEWAKHGILVNAVAPGYIATELNEELINDEAFDAWVKQRCPLGRWGKPEDVAGLVVFLAGDSSTFITGQVIYVDGGWLATF